MTISSIAIEPLSAQEEVSLAKTIEAAVYAEHLIAEGAMRVDEKLEALFDQANHARGQLYKANLLLATNLANRWAERLGLPREELVQEACIGLGEAIKRWDWARGVKFTTYAWRLINGTLAKASAVRCGEIDITVSAARTIWKARKTWRELELKEGRSIPGSRLAKEAKVSGYLHLVMNAGRHVRLVPEIAENLSAPESEQIDLPSDWAAVLNRQEETIVRMHYGIGVEARTRNYIANQLNTSVSSVRRTELRALRKLRGFIQDAA